MAKRKLTTIFCADAVHYGALMAANEDATLARLQEYREVMNDLFSRFGGHEINTWGDAIIAEFDSVVEAVRCAVEIQSALNSRNADLAGDEKLQFRIGINLGDVIHQGDNIYGDGVNIASRLESMAEPGGIMVSKSVHDFTARQLAIGFDFDGSHVSKQGEAPIEAYRVRMGAQGNKPPNDNPQRDKDQPGQPNLKEDARTFADSVKALPTVGWAQRWYEAQNKKVQYSVIMIGGFFLLNLFLTGLADPWFIFPSLPFLVIILLGRRRMGDGDSAQDKGRDGGK